jgi:uncharacterized integral membrane protein
MPDHDRQPPEGRRVSPRAVLWIVVGVLVVTFILQNTEKARIKFLFIDIESGVWFALIVALVIGAAIGYFAGRSGRFGRDRT